MCIYTAGSAGYCARPPISPVTTITSPGGLLANIGWQNTKPSLAVRFVLLIKSSALFKLKLRQKQEDLVNLGNQFNLVVQSLARPIDKLNDRLTSYRLMLYFLLAITGWAIAGSFFSKQI